MLNACRVVMVMHRVLSLRVWRSCMKVLAKSSLSRAIGAQGQPKAGININEELFKIWKRDCIPFYVPMISVAI